MFRREQDCRGKGDRVVKGAREKLEAEIGVDMPMPENCIERPDNRKGLK
jgi:hypothetical protein